MLSILFRLEKFDFSAPKCSSLTQLIIYFTCRYSPLQEQLQMQKPAACPIAAHTVVAVAMRRKRSSLRSSFTRASTPSSTS